MNKELERPVTGLTNVLKSENTDLFGPQTNIIAAANEMIATISMNQQLRFVNSAGRALLGIPQDRDLIHEPLFVADFHSETVYSLLTDHVFPTVVAKRETWQGDLEFISLNQQTIPVHLKVIPHLDELGDVVWITGVAKDLREQNALEIQQRLAKRVFDNTIEGIFVTDADARILQVNRAFCEITGYSAAEVMGKTPRLFQSNHHDVNFYVSLWSQVNIAGFWQGEIWNRRKDGSVFLQWLSINCLKNQRQEVEFYVAVFHDLSELRAREAQIEFLVNHDPLTRLGNRAQLVERIKLNLQNPTQSGQRIAVIKMDLGEIQLINDSLGHAFCDRLIQQAARRLQKRVARQGLLVRLAADEFGVLVTHIAHAVEISAFVDQLKTALQQPFELDNEILYMNPSLGVAFYPDDADNLDDLLRHAQIALQQAKQAGRNQFYFYNPDMSHQAKHRLCLEQALREAIVSDGLSLNFQPKVDLQSGKVLSAEVLVRWQHPIQGFISPADFIPIAEKAGLIADLGSWVMRTTCRYLAEMKAQGLQILPVAINLSVYELERIGLVNHLIDCVEAYDLEPGLFEFEVTETGLMSREEQVITALTQLRAKGFRVALDDFGTGYSSLSYLRKLPLTTLKIDRAFVKDLTEDKVAASIVRTVIALADSLELEIVAEGVETPDQQSLLQQLGCAKAQGYYFYRPLAYTDYQQLLTRMVETT